jgi:hypothetical protein
MRAGREPPGKLDPVAFGLFVQLTLEEQTIRRRANRSSARNVPRIECGNVDVASQVVDGWSLVETKPAPAFGGASRPRARDAATNAHGGLIQILSVRLCRKIPSPRFSRRVLLAKSFRRREKPSCAL